MQKNNLFLHIDGARFIYAPTILNTNFQQLCQGVDALSFGGTKNGLLFGEAVVLFHENADFKFIRKQSMQLPSKMRFLAGQFIELLSSQKDGFLFEQVASHGHQLAKYLKEKLCNIEEVRITQPVQANSVFVEIPQSWIKPLRKEFFFYVWNEETFECRLMISFDSTKEHIDKFIDHLIFVKNNHPIRS